MILFIIIGLKNLSHLTKKFFVQNYIKTDKYGYFNFENLVKSGLNKITLSYPGNNIYRSTKISTTYHKTPINTEISLIKVDDYSNNELKTIYGNLTESYYTPLKNTKITVNENGKITTLKTDNNGHFTYKYIEKEMDFKNIIVSFAGNTTHTGSTAITNNKLFDTKIFTEITGYAVGERVTIRGYVQDIIRGYELYDMPVTININGNTYNLRTDKIDDSDNPYFEYSFIAKKCVYNVTIKFTNNTKYTNSIKKITIPIGGKETTLIISEATKTNDNKYIKIVGKIYDSKGKMLQNVPIRIDLDGKTYNTHTDNTGTYTKYIKNNKVIEHTLYVTFEGNSVYNQFREEIIFTSHKEGEIEIATPLAPGDYEIYNNKAEIINVGTDKIISWHQKATERDPAGAYLDLFSRPDAIARANEIISVTFYYKNNHDNNDIITRTTYSPDTNNYCNGYYSKNIDGYTPYKTVVKYRHLTSNEITNFHHSTYY